MSKELEAAFNRLRQSVLPWGWDSSRCEDYLADKNISQDWSRLARAYLAEHPADEDELITEEWLESVGFYRPVDGGQLTIEVDAVTFLTVDSERTAWRLTDTEPGDSEAGSVWIDERKTRGDVYRLAKVLGIELKAGVEV